MASVQGQIIDALEVMWRSVVTDLRPGDLGFLRGKVSVETWGPERLPFLMAHSPSKDESSIDSFEQVDAAYSTAFELWDIATQETMLQRYDDFRALLRADVTLGGLVEFSFTPGERMDEANGESRRGMAVIVQCEAFES